MKKDGRRMEEKTSRMVEEKKVVKKKMPMKKGCK